MKYLGPGYGSARNYDRAAHPELLLMYDTIQSRTVVCYITTQA